MIIRAIQRGNVANFLARCLTARHSIRFVYLFYMYINITDWQNEIDTRVVGKSLPNASYSSQETDDLLFHSNLLIRSESVEYMNLNFRGVIHTERVIAASEVLAFILYSILNFGCFSKADSPYNDRNLLTYYYVQQWRCLHSLMCA